MTDFYDLLKQSMLDRGIRNVKDRAEVYAQARRAVIKQLWDFRPPLAADEIDTRVGAYDTAVERIEADLQVAFAKGGKLPTVVQRARARPQPAMAANGQGASAAAWVEEVEYERGIPRSAPPQYEDAAFAYDDDEADYTVVEEVRSDRWTPPRTAAPTGPSLPWREWLGTGEETRVRLLIAAIGGLFLVLVGIGAYFLTARNDGGVTLAIGVRREVSDAATASRIAAETVDVTQSFAVFDGKDPTIFSTTPDNPIRFDSVNGFARVSSSTSAPGIKVLIGPGLASRLAGKQVRVVITARSSIETGAAGMRFAYQSGLAISHWQTANLSSDYETVGMVWRLPAMRTSPAGDFLLIEPGIPGDGTGADIQAIRIDVLAS